MTVTVERERNLSILFAGSLFVWALRDLVETRGWFKDSFIADLVKPKWIGTAATVGVLLFGGLTTAWVVQAGHSGAKAAWKGKLQAPRPGSEH